MDTVLSFYALVCGAILLQAALMWLHAWEHGRFHASRLATGLKPGDPLRVTLFIPCKGMDLNIESHLRALFEQQYPRLELCFILERDGEPPADVIRDFQQRYPHVASRIVFAGEAEACGQKVHNLMTATRTIGPDTEVLAFVDSDACPHPDWLARLVDKLRGRNAVSTGYRWYVPQRPTLPNRLLSAINNTITGLLGPHGFNLVWGGAWAIRAETFHSLGLPEAWQGSLSDDLVVSRLVRRAGIKVAYDPHCLVTSPADMGFVALAEFLRRQYLVVRVYAPLSWLGAFSAGLAAIIMCGLSLGLSLYWLVTDGPWWFPAGAGGIYYGLTAGRAAIRAAAVRPFVKVDSRTYGQVARMDIWGWPLVALANCLGLLAAGIGRRIVWRGIRYRLVSPQQTTIESRPGRSNADNQITGAFLAQGLPTPEVAQTHIRADRISMAEPGRGRGPQKAPRAA